MMDCKKCKSSNTVKNGTTTLRDGKYQMYRCNDCGHVFIGEQLTVFEAKLRINDKK